MTKLTPLEMVHLVREALAHVRRTQRKVWNIGSRECTKYPPNDVPTLLDHCVGLERNYATRPSMMV